MRWPFGDRTIPPLLVYLLLGLAIALYLVEAWLFFGAFLGGRGLDDLLGGTPKVTATPTLTTASVVLAATQETTAPPPTPTPVPPPPTATPTPLPPPPTATSTPLAATPTPTPKPSPTPTPTPPTAVVLPNEFGGAVLRLAPTQASQVVAHLMPGSRLLVLGEVSGEAVAPPDDRWLQVRYNTFTGYVYANLVKLEEGNNSTASTTGESVGLSPEGVASPEVGEDIFLRAQPSTSAPVLAVVPKGELLKLLQEVLGEAVTPGDDHWLRVRYGETEGYVYRRLVAIPLVREDP